jgi:phage terminase large subunit-like protein
VTGKKAIGVFIDELHEFGKSAKAASMLTEATGGITSRPEGFVFYCTTQSSEPPAGVFKDKLSYARKVRDGTVVDPRFLPVIYEFPDHMIQARAYENLDNAYITNPNWNISVDAEVIGQKIQEAQEAGAHALLDIRAKHLNVEIGLNLRTDRWAGADFWLEAGAVNVTLDYLLEQCEVVVVGIDGGGLDDLLGLTLVGRERGTGRWLTWSHAWAHEIALERRPEIAPALRDFEKQGDLTIVALPGDDVKGVADIVCRVQLAALLPEENAIGVDAAGITDIVDELISESRGIEMKQIVAISQGWKLNGAIKTTERAVAGGELVHGAQPMMAWCVGNARTEDRGNAISVTKQVSGKAKIDPLMALFNAVSLMALKPKAMSKPKPGIYIL